MLALVWNSNNFYLIAYLFNDIEINTILQKHEETSKNMKVIFFEINFSNIHLFSIKISTK